MNIFVVSTEEHLRRHLLKCRALAGPVAPVIGPGPARAVRASRCRRRHAINVILPSGMASGFLFDSWRDSRPLGSEAPGCAVEGAEGFFWNVRQRNGPKS